MQLYRKGFRELTTEELYKILKLRVAVFVVEQNCPYMELDDLDQSAIHVWMEDEDGILAYLRVMDKGAENEAVSLGRVIAVKRRRGFGSRILSEGIRTAKECFHADSIDLEAQVSAKKFYEKQGFRQISEVFLLDGIPHVKMRMDRRSGRL
jgi:ElaA protein